MKSQYLLIRVNAPMASDTVVYHVWVGTSERETQLFQLAQSWARSSGATFRLWSEDVDFWLEYEADKVFSGCGILNFGFQRADVSIGELVKLIDGRMFEAFEKSLTQPKVFFSMLRHYRPTVDNPQFRAKPIASLPTLPRKNLIVRNSRL